MNAITATATTPLAVVAAPRTFRRSRLLLTALAALIVTLLTVGVGAPAEAHTYLGATGRYGAVYFPAAPATIAPGVVQVPAVAVGRNGAVPANSSQRVWVTYILDRWDGRSWVASTYMTSPSTIRETQATVYASSGSLPIKATGSYRLRTFIQWGYQNTIGTEQMVSGSQSLATDSVSDFRCAASRCTVSPGYFTAS